LRLFLSASAITAIGIAIATQAAAMYTAEGAAPLSGWVLSVGGVEDVSCGKPP